MLKIAICDDNPDDLDKIRLFLNEYLTINKLTAQIQEFNNPNQLLDMIETNPFNLYILDIVMPMVHGIELGRELRKYDKSCAILYATSESQFALEAYASNPINYLLKPVDKNKFFDTLDFLFSKKNFSDEATFTFKTKEGYYTYPLYQIEYCEYTNHKVRFFIKGEKNEKITMTVSSFQEYMAPILDNENFVQANSSCIINVVYIASLSRNEIELTNSKTISVSRNNYNLVREAYFAYQVGGAFFG